MVFGKFNPLMETFLEFETMCRKPPPGHVFVKSLVEIDSRKVAEVVRCSRDKKRLCDPSFRALQNPYHDFAGNVQGLVFSGLNPTCQVSSKSVQVSVSY